MSVTAEPLDVPEKTEPRLWEASFARPVYAATAVVAVVLCSGMLLPWWIHLYSLWSKDPLRSIGEWFPLVSMLGVLQAWRRLGWTLDGTYWGLLPIAASIPLAHLVLTRFPQLYINGHELGLAKTCSPFLLCAVGAVLLFGGPRLLRGCWPPLVLLLLLDPVPHVYNEWLDLPLQNLSAHTARSFAHLIGLQPTGQQLRMMFTPSFGMMIVPGCDGIRGSVTFGYLALFFGYSRGLRARILTALVALAVLAGFAINLLRLCLLVIYYRIGVSLTPIQSYGVQVDYAIGCSLFLIAALCLGLALRSLPSKTSPVIVPLSRPGKAETRSMLLRGASLVGLSFVYLAFEMHSPDPALSMDFKMYSSHSALAKPQSEEAIYALFPSSVGRYRLVRTHGESLQNDGLAFAFGDYQQDEAAGAAPSSITLGLWVQSRYHQVAESRRARGLEPTWTGAFHADADIPVHFASHTYDDGIKAEYDAEAICSVEVCSGNPIKTQLSLGKDAAGHLRFSLSQSHRLPILLHREWPSGESTQSAARRNLFETDARTFIRDLKLQPLVAQLGSQF